MKDREVVERVLTTTIRWDKYPSMIQLTSYREKAYLILVVVEEELGEGSLSSPEITEIINRKFRVHNARQSSITNALKRGIGSEVDTKIVEGVIRYSILPAGRDVIHKFSVEERHLDISPEEERRLEAIQCYEMLEIHPEIRAVSESLFNSGHHAQAIFEAYKKVDNLVKSASGMQSLHGKALMLKAFSPKNPILFLNDLSTRSGLDEQEGFMHLYAGAMMGIRNPKGHDEVVQVDPFKTIEYLCFASLLAKRVDECSL